MPPRDLHACLVHECRECAIDLVRNLHHLDPESTILLYNDGSDGALLDGGFAWERYSAIVHPSPRPMTWGWYAAIPIPSPCTGGARPTDMARLVVA